MASIINEHGACLISEILNLMLCNVILVMSIDITERDSLIGAFYSLTKRLRCKYANVTMVVLVCCDVVLLIKAFKGFLGFNGIVNRATVVSCKWT
jgi:hypothetical protein